MVLICSKFREALQLCSRGVCMFATDSNDKNQGALARKEGACSPLAVQKKRESERLWVRPTLSPKPGRE